MNTDKLFIKTVEDICEIIDEPNEYGLLRSSLLLRQLLLDENRLVHIVNRNRKLKISVTIQRKNKK